MDVFRRHGGLNHYNCRVLFTLTIIQMFALIQCESETDFIDWTKVKPKVCAKDESYEMVTKDKVIDIFYKLIITDLFDVSEERMEFGLQTFVFDIWRDPLMNLTDKVRKLQQTIPSAVDECLWKPDLIFPNCKKMELYSVTVKNSILKLILQGYILRYSRFNLVVSCPMEFKDYPMDTQTCTLQITMFSHFADKVRLHWLEDMDKFVDMGWLKTVFGKSISWLPGVKPLQFSMKDPEGRKKSFQIAKSLNGTMLIVEFEFNRHLTASLINTYIPSFLVVSLSMVSFWLDVTAVPGRVTLGVTAMLTLATEIVHARSCLPPVDYMTAMDIWLFGCLVMVFLSLIEFTIAHSIHRKPRTVKNKATIGILNKVPMLNAWSLGSRNQRIPSSSRKPEETQDEKDKKQRKKESESQSRTETEKINNQGDTYIPSYEKDNVLDRLSRVVFPCSMMFFSTTYWLYYVAKKNL